jgi:hypothetical protein
MLFWGSPGVGKSTIIENICTRYGLPCEILSPGERGEGAFGVTPVPDGEYMTYPPPEWVTNVDPCGAVLVDEINCAAPAMPPYLLGLVLARRVGGHQLGNRVRTIAAANPPEEAAGGWDLALALSNRFGHMNWDKPSAEDWGAWVFGSIDDEIEQAIDPLEEEARVTKAWGRHWATARALIVGFLRRKPEMIHKQPELGNPQASRAWCSHRSWEMAMRAHASAHVHGLSVEETEDFVASFVGPGAAGELHTYQKKADLPDPADVLDGKVEFKHNPKRIDRTFAVVNSCTVFVIDESMTENRDARLDKLFEILLKMSGDTVDVVWGAAKLISKAGLIKHSADSRKLGKRLLSVDKDANFTGRAA